MVSICTALATKFGGARLVWVVGLGKLVVRCIHVSLALRLAVSRGKAGGRELRWEA